ncbi:MAG: iron export ABC transporter permease subunit FetB [Proteobacteria bacterium]|nr:iron export ABC transporter permease subunit FetB [Pseudomonadota bacterium]
MEHHIIDIGPYQLAICLIFVVISGIASIVYSLKLEKDLLIGTVRTFVQLFILGYVLKFVFAMSNMFLVIGVFAFMIFFAAWTIYGRVKDKQIHFFFPVFVSMLLSFFLVAFLVTAVVVNVKPWWEPRYFIPLGGMVIGNSMNAIAIAIERLIGDLKSKRGEIEMKLCLGADSREASKLLLQKAMQAGMIPSINSMMAVGMVFIPGMMTGQILSGSDPLIAIKYQIVVMIMLTGSTALGTLITVLLVRNRCFNKAEQLVLKPD